jgi:Raf kinase inhibitor-like YbhB/YbcL family protein
MSRWRARDGLAMGRAHAARLLLLGSFLIGVDVLSIGAASGTEMALTISSPAFKQGGKILSSYTCEGDDVSPPLVFAGVPKGAKSLALVIDDPDAPDPSAPKRVWVHWVVVNLPPDTSGLEENASAVGLPKGAVQGVNDFRNKAYGGPCPPIGRHRYFHKLYALDVTLPAKAVSKAELEAAMEGHVLGKAELMGTYQKGDP